MTTNAQPTTTAERFAEADHDNTNGFAKLPRLLRGFGAATLVAAISIFLFQGWEGGNDSYRYFLLLGHTVGLAIIGFLSGHFIRESKGARLLLALALASIPANFAILGGFVFSQFGMPLGNYPDFVQWAASSPEAAIGLTAVAIALLIPVMWLGFMVLTRRNALRFSAMFLLTNAAILIPLRDPSLIGWMVLGLAFMVMLFNRRALIKDSALRTPEGVLARVLQFLPLGVLVGRTLWLYSADVFLMTTMATVVFFLMRHIAMLLDKDDFKRGLLEGLSVIPALGVGFGSAWLVSSYFGSEPGVFLPVFALTLGALLMELGMRATHGASMFRRMAAAVVTLGMLANLVLFGGVFMAALCLALGLAIVIYGYMVEQRIVFALGAVTLLAGLGHQLQYAIHFFELGSWGSLAALGVSTIVIGSLIERHGERIKGRLVQWTRQFRSWEY